MSEGVRGAVNRLLLTAFAGMASIVAAGAQPAPVTLVMVRHAEVAPEPPTFPLSALGHQRARLLVHTFSDLKFTHVFASHTTRARQTVEPVAAAQKLRVVQLPAPGSESNGARVSDVTASQAAIEPVAQALLQLPPGSVALVGVNSDNIYGILNRLGVRVAAPAQACTPVDPCVPCLTNACYPGSDYDRLVYVVIEAGRPKPVVMIETRYGAGWVPGSGNRQ